MAQANGNTIKPKVCKTVGSLIKQLEKYPKKTKVNQGMFKQGVVPVLYNEGYESEHMVFEEV